MGVTTSTSVQAIREVEPIWVKTLQVPAEYAQDCIGSCSTDGFTLTGPGSFFRHRLGHFDSDGAKWSRGFTSGKHVFQIQYPAALRGAEATVGVATESAPVYVKGKVPLVGYGRDSWGISLRTRRAFHRNAIVKKYPATQVQLPDKFYMYLDLDAGVLQFGSDHAFYGTAHNDLPKGQPFYPMVSSSDHGATVIMTYLGAGILAHPGSHVMLSSHPQQNTVVVSRGATAATVITTQHAQPADAPYPPPPPAGVIYPPPPPAYAPEDPEFKGQPEKQ